jgi:hypothetical protein
MSYATGCNSFTSQYLLQILPITCNKYVKNIAPQIRPPSALPHKVLNAKSDQHLRVTYKTSVWIGWLCSLHLIHSHNSGLQVLQRYRYSTHFTVHRYTRTRILSLHQPYSGNGFITVWLQIQLTWNLFVTVWFLSCHFFSATFRLPSPELDPILVLAAWDPRYIASRRADREHCFLCYEGVSTAPFHSNGSYSIVACVFIAAGCVYRVVA